MTLGILESIRTAMVTLLSTAIDGGPAAGKVKIYDGAMPATGAAVTTQNLLGTVLCSDPCASGIAAGVLTFDDFTDDDDADGSGTATWARITDSDDNFVCDASIGTSGADLNLNSTTITAGGIIISQYPVGLTI